ncbi:MAG: DUF3375 domain-containing protein [Oscillatoriales cyanobacterium RU_3_3]|nr:DUF3375 domain-containing protein [Microcoleus sp. SU_5_3]NJM59726.1 DUF3375 domain-containing protein [Oscillatoriales cyanobacterium RU_3_3]
MEYEQIKHELKTSAIIKLLRSQNAALIISFLYKQFKVSQKNSVAQIDLETKLSDYLEFLQDIYPEAYRRSPKEYLSEWCDDRLLRKTFDSRDDAVFTLTPATEKAIAWLEELQKPDEFVGTESRFLQIFSLLKEIQDRSTTDVETRLAQLERDRDILQQEIDLIRQTGELDRYNPTQLQERFLLADRVSRQLISDFKDIEQNFRNLTRKVQEAQFEKDSRKGTAIGRVLDADRELKESDQGRSFYAFWNFLMSDSKRQELKFMIQTVYQLEELQALTQDYQLLRRIERSLLNAAEHIVQSNHQLAEKLRQMLDERNLQENRRVAESISEVLRLALQLTNNAPTEPDFWNLEGEPAVYLPMERPLHPLAESEVPTFSLDFTNLPELTQNEEIAELYQQFYVDEDLLVQRIDLALEHRSSITLADLIQLYPVTQGLAEIVAYLAIADRSDCHSIDPDIIDSITIPSLDSEKQLQLTLPQIIFRR